MLINIRKHLKNQKGFTLVELMAVVAIIGILAAIAIPKFSSATDTANLGKMKGDLNSINSASAMFYSANNNTWPTKVSDLSNYFTTTPTPPTSYKTYGAVTYNINTTTGMAYATISGNSYYADSTNWP